MIEKLDVIKHTENLFDKNGFITNVACGGVIISKVNELIDAVNSIIGVQEKLIDSRFVVETKHEEPADLYAEQRKWIGKLCRFRDKDYKDDQWDYGLLQAVEKAETAHIWKTGYFKHNLGHWYDCCEPVKPDDPIIYKGEKCETRAENVQPDYATITYMSDGHIKKFYGHDSIVELEVPLPQGTRITIKSITKGGDNDIPAN